MSFGPFENVQRMVSKLSIPELTQLAKNPTGDDPNVQFAAVSEIQRRNAMKAPPNALVAHSLLSSTRWRWRL